LEFPKRVFTEDEVKQARELIGKGYKHSLTIKGSVKFKNQLQKALELIKVASYYDFLCTYIRSIEEIEGFSQLHEADAVIWANMPMLTDTVDAASYIVQKAQQMKDYIEGRLYYGTGEMIAIEKRLEFLEKLKEQSNNEIVKRKCDDLLKKWSESKMMFP